MICTILTIRKFLEPLRAFQLQIMLKDDVAGEVVKDAARMRVESSLDSALKNVRERTRKKDYGLALKVALDCCIPIPSWILIDSEKIIAAYGPGFLSFRP